MLPFHRRRTQGLEDMSGHMEMETGACATVPSKENTRTNKQKNKFNMIESSMI